jgi:beta-lactamase class C
MLKEVPAISPPGEVYSYQNVVYSLIADILKKATGKCYNSLVVEKIFYPLEMKDASIDFYSLVKGSNTAKPHLIRNNNYKARKIRDKYFSTSPASGVNTSISDLSKYLTALLKGYPDVISPEILNEIYRPHIKTHIRRRYIRNWKYLGDLYYGLGWRIVNYRDNEIIYHGGYVTGYRAEIALCPDEGIAIAVLINSSSKLANKCIPAFFDMYFNKTMI